jgi:hypothetical protein
LTSTFSASVINISRIILAILIVIIVVSSVSSVIIVVIILVAVVIVIKVGISIRGEWNHRGNMHIREWLVERNMGNDIERRVVWDIIRDSYGIFIELVASIDWHNHVGVKRVHGRW